MAKKVQFDYSKAYKTDGQILSKLVDPLKEKGLEYLGYIGYALYKIEKNNEVETYKKSHPKATNSDIQKIKDSFRYSHCADNEINRYWDSARQISDNMYGKRLEEYIDGFENGAEGERKHLTEGFEKLLSNNVGTAIDGKYKLEKKNNFGIGVLQSFLGTIVWVALTIFVGLHNKYGNGNDSSGGNQSSVNAPQSIIDTTCTDNDTIKYVINNQ